MQSVTSIVYSRIRVIGIWPGWRWRFVLFITYIFNTHVFCPYNTVMYCITQDMVV